MAGGSLAGSKFLPGEMVTVGELDPTRIRLVR